MSDFSLADWPTSGLSLLVAWMCFMFTASMASYWPRWMPEPDKPSENMSGLTASWWLALCSSKVGVKEWIVL
ncbi:hypothetical protein COR52_19490 [Vibrio mediterranei]|nr:hypothetical protein COR52_19490 [Vibrio mediterranei]